MTKKLIIAEKWEKNLRNVTSSAVQVEAKLIFSMRTSVYIYIYPQSPLSMLIYLYILKIKFNLCLSFSRNIFIKKINFSINQRVVIRTFCLLHHYPLSLQNTVQGSSYCMFSQYCFLSSLCTMVISRKENIIYMNTKYIWISF